MKFREWLKTQESRDDPVGDIARDIRDDDCLPRGSSIRTIEQHIRAKHSPEERAIEALRKAHSEYCWGKKFCEDLPGDG